MSVPGFDQLRRPSICLHIRCITGFTVLAPSFSLECILSGSIPSGLRMSCHRDKGGKTDHGTEDMDQAKFQCQIADIRLSVSLDVKGNSIKSIM